MQNIYVCQIIDMTSESIINNFMAPNQKYAERQFKSFLTNPKWSDSIDPSDFALVMSKPVCVFGSFSEYLNDFANSLMDFVCYGHDIVMEESNES